MAISSEQLRQKRCLPCEGGIVRLPAERAHELLAATPEWRLTADGKRIERSWTTFDFASALNFFNAVGVLAEEQDHHPDLHLTGYRHVKIELTTHALDGLSENDFILASKIDMIPVHLKTK